MKKSSITNIFLITLLLTFLVIPFINLTRSDSAILVINGSQIKDSNGNTVHLRGVVYDSDQWWTNNPTLGADQFTYMKIWGCNVVRINVQCYTLESNKAIYGTALGNAAFMTRLDNLINWATSAGLYVILNGFHTSTGNCPHSIPNNQLDHYMTVDWTWAEWVTIWDIYATRYASNNMVLYELINEPLKVPYSTYQTEIRAAIDAIRTHNPNAVCVVQEAGSGSWDTASLQFEQSYPISRPNIIYSVHDYGYHFSSNTLTTLRYKLGSNGAYCHYADWMLANGRCVISTEFGGGYNQQPNYAFDSWTTAWLQNWMTVMDSDGYSGYTAHRWVTSGWTCEKLLNDWSGNPSSYGQIIKSVLSTFPVTTTTGTYLSSTTSYGTITVTSTSGTTTSTVTGGGSPFFSNGYEEGDFSAWTGHTGGYVQNSVKKSGSYAAKFNATATHSNQIITGSMIEATEDVQIHTLPTAYHQVDLMRLETSGFSNLVEISFFEWLGVYYLSLHVTYPASADYNYAFSLQADTWYTIKLRFVQSATIGEYRVWLDGTEMITQTGLNTNSAVVGFFEAGSVYASYTTNLYVDDVILYNSASDSTTTITSGTITYLTTLYSTGTSTITSNPTTGTITLTTTIYDTRTETATLGITTTQVSWTATSDTTTFVTTSDTTIILTVIVGGYTSSVTMETTTVGSAIGDLPEILPTAATIIVVLGIASVFVYYFKRH